jgi:hypothetical protein
MQVIRAALHIGLLLLARAMLDETRNRSVIAVLKQYENMHDQGNIHDSILDVYNAQYALFRRGIIDSGQVNTIERELLGTVSKDLSKLLRQRFIEIKSGQRVGNMYILQHHGGDRKSNEY